MAWPEGKAFWRKSKGLNSTHQKAKHRVDFVPHLKPTEQLAF